MHIETCRICSGDGYITNAFGGGNERCPSCRGSGRRADDTGLFRDVTKTKPSHHKPQAKAKEAKQTWPTTFEGMKLAKEVQESPACTDDTKARLIREIIEYEGSHGSCTQTFSRKVRKQIRTK